MITCKECRERLYPDDPRIPVGRYHHSTCVYFCDKPMYNRELEATEPQVVEHIHRTSNMSRKEFDCLERLIERLIKERLDKNKRKSRYT